MGLVGKYTRVIQTGALALGLAGAMSFSASASAGVLSGHTAAYNDGLGPSAGAWTATTAFDNGVGLSGTVDWAVFGPGDFPYAGYAPPAGELVYAFQIFSTGTDAIHSLTRRGIDAAPVTGQGLDTFRHLYFRYRDLDIPWESPRYDKAHNTYLEVAVTRNWQAREGVSRDVIRGCLPISGVYDLTPAGWQGEGRPPCLPDDDEGRVESPVHRLQETPPPFLITWGSDDYPFLILQGKAFANAVGDAGGEAETLELPDKTHFTVHYEGAAANGDWTERALAWIATH